MAQATIPVKGIPFINSVTAMKHFMLFEKTETSLRFKVMTHSSGVPNASCHQTYETWDFVTMDPRSKKCAVRQGFKIHFSNKPTFFAGKIEKNISEK